MIVFYINRIFKNEENLALKTKSSVKIFMLLFFN